MPVNHADVAVATVTWARSAAEERQLSSALQTLSASRLPVAVCDRSDSPALREQLARIDGFAVTQPRERTLVAQVQASVTLAAARGRPFILYTEPDKAHFFAHGVTDFLRDAPAAADVGVILAGRSARSFATYPPMQRYTEGVINHLCGALVGTAGDYAYGPLLFSTALVPLVAELDPHVGWGWRTALIGEAHRRGLRILGVTGDFPCPADQIDENASDRTHRLRQLSQNVLGLAR